MRDEDKTKRQLIAELTELRHRITKMEWILEISRDLNSTIDLNHLLHKIVTVAAELTNSERGGLLLLNSDTGNLHFRAESTYTLGQLSDIPVPIEDSIVGKAFLSGEPIVHSNVQTDPRYSPGVDQQTGYLTRSLLSVPIQINERRIGVLNTLNKRGEDTFSQQDVKTLTTLATQAAVAIENVRLITSLQEAHDKLEERVAERTAELQMRNEELDAFAHTVAHDLKNPIGVLTGMAEILEIDHGTLPPDRLSEYLQSIARSGRKANAIIEELLLLAGLRQQEVQIIALDMGDILTEVLTRLKHMISEYQAEILFPESWPVALGYAPWVEEVWTNYLSNGIKYGGRPPQLELGATRQSDGMVRFWVRDNGSGLTPEEQTKLFKPFTRLQVSEVKGHGLGLSIVKRIVEKLGGQVGVMSTGRSDQGSVFYFCLPSPEKL